MTRDGVLSLACVVSALPSTSVHCTWYLVYSSSSSSTIADTRSVCIWLLHVKCVVYVQQPLLNFRRAGRWPSSVLRCLGDHEWHVGYELTEGYLVPGRYMVRAT